MMITFHDEYGSNVQTSTRNVSQDTNTTLYVRQWGFGTRNRGKRVFMMTTLYGYKTTLAETLIITKRTLVHRAQQ
jgi:hypothetical protein